MAAGKRGSERQSRKEGLVRLKYGLQSSSSTYVEITKNAQCFLKTTWFAGWCHKPFTGFSTVVFLSFTLWSDKEEPPAFNF